MYQLVCSATLYLNGLLIVIRNLHHLRPTLVSIKFNFAFHCVYLTYFALSVCCKCTHIHIQQTSKHCIRIFAWHFATHLFVYCKVISRKMLYWYYGADRVLTIKILECIYFVFRYLSHNFCHQSHHFFADFGLVARSTIVHPIVPQDFRVNEI